MSTPRSCARCLTPLADLPPGETCPVCGSALELVETAAATPPGPDTPAAVPETPVYVPADPFGPTPTAAPETAATALLDGDHPRPSRVPTLANYQVLRRIGSGGMGDVYQAIQRRVGRLVALKVIQGFGGLEARQRARFQNEVEALGRAAHPNVVTVYDVGEEEGTPYYSMEYIPGGTLADRVRDGQPVPAAEAADLVAAAAAGVAAAHRVGVLHRDLKPSNVLIAADGTVKVGDFGLAKLLDRDDGPTRSGQMVGTPSYMAPEQAGGKPAELGPHTDVYGLGATLYHLLTGRPPFREETPMGTAVRVLNEAPPAPRRVCPDLCPVLEAVVQKAMAKAPADRYPSARALADDLANWRQGEPTAARPATGWQRTKRWLRRNRVAVAAAVGVAAAVVALFLARPDPNAQQRDLERKLANGQPVTLIGETGNPAWHRWAHGEVALAGSVVGDGRCGFQTVNLSLLELCPDPQSDYYRLEAEFQHLLPGVGDATFAGVYLGWSESPGPGGTAVRRFIGFNFDDISWPQNPRLGVTGEDHVLAQCNDRMRAHSLGLLPLPFAPSQAEHKPWRKFVIDVTPETITARWWDGTQLVTAQTVTAADLESFRAEHEQFFTMKKWHLPAAVPAWHPRRPLGVYAQHAAAAFKNVILTPTPSP